MCNDSLVQAIQRYLDAEINVEGATHEDASPPRPPEQAENARKRLLDARRHLQDELYGYAEARAREVSFQRILVAVNDSTPSRWAVEVAARMAEDLGAKLAIVHVVEPPRPIPSEVGWIDVGVGERGERLRAGEEMIRQARWHIPSTVHVERLLREGDPAHEITAAARQWNADLIVIGSHGRGRLATLLFGSTSQAVTQLVPCPVLTVAHRPTPSRRVKAFLDSRHVPYAVIPHAPEFTAMETAAAAHVAGRELAKTTIVKLDGDPAMVVLPSHHLVDLDLLRLVTEAREVMLATEEEFVGLFPDCELGAMPPFGNLYGMKVFVAESLARDEYIAFNSGTHTELIRMKYADFETLVRPRVVSVSEPMELAER